MAGWSLPDRLWADVRSPDPAVRVAAVEDLGAVVDAGADARAELERVADSDVPEVADVASRVLAGWRSARPSPLLDPLHKALHEPPHEPSLEPAAPPAPPAATSEPARLPRGVVTAQDARSRTFTRTKWREGYDPDDVDAYLALVAQALEQRSADVGAGRRGQPPGLRPEDVVNKRFAATKFREGYDQDEVDDYLDQVVNSLRSLDERMG
jgi:DivIVA domain-containing protein